MSGGELLAAAGIAYLLGVTRDGKVVPVSPSQITLPVEVEFRPYLFRTSIAAGAKKTIFSIETRPEYKTYIRLFGQNWFADSVWRLVRPDTSPLEWEHQLSYLFSPMSLNQPLEKNCLLEIENNGVAAHDYNVAIFLEGPTTKISGLTDGAIDSSSMAITTSVSAHVLADIVGFGASHYSASLTAGQVLQAISTDNAKFQPIDLGVLAPTGRLGLGNLPVGTDGMFYRGDGAGSPVVEAIEFVCPGILLNPTAAVNVIMGRFSFPCTVTNVRGYRVGGTGATINARRNGVDNHLATALSLTSADAWMDGGAVQNTAYAVGNKLELMLVTVVGTPTQIGIQVDFTRP